MTHRVGTLTLGITMLAIGILYFVRIFWSGMDAMWIYRFWPVIFISLGVEILLANAQKGVQIINIKDFSCICADIFCFFYGGGAAGSRIGMVLVVVRVTIKIVHFFLANTNIL